MKLVATIAAVTMVISACGAGANGEDQHRLDILRNEPASTLEPPDSAPIGGPPSEVLATTDNAKLQGCCSTGILSLYDSEATANDILRSYADRLGELGWQDLVASCSSGTSSLIGFKQFDSFVARFRSEVSHQGPPFRVFQGVTAKYHTADHPEPTGAAPDLTCIT